MSIPIIINQEMREYFKNNYVKDDEECLQTVLKKLRDKGYSQMESIFLLIEELKMSFVEANRVILNSRAWKG